MRIKREWGIIPHGRRGSERREMKDGRVRKEKTWKEGMWKAKGLNKPDVSSEVNVKRNKNQRITVDVEEKWDDDVVEGKSGNSRGREELKRRESKGDRLIDRWTNRRLNMSYSKYQERRGKNGWQGRGRKSQQWKEVDVRGCQQVEELQA